MLSSRAMYLVLLAFSLLSSLDAHAGDYTISYAIEAGDLNDSGTIRDCRYHESCRIRSDKLDLWILLYLHFSDREKSNEMIISVDGGRSRPACCYFSDGVRQLSRNVEQPLVRLGVYEGHARRRNEFIQNLPVGVLHLQFSDMK